MDRLATAIHEFSLLSDEIVDRAPTLLWLQRDAAAILSGLFDEAMP
ncbi:hypothetical protein AB7M63_001744 [Bradyrhizobium japonicum]